MVGCARAIGRVRVAGRSSIVRVVLVNSGRADPRGESLSVGRTTKIAALAPAARVASEIGKTGVSACRSAKEPLGRAEESVRGLRRTGNSACAYVTSLGAASYTYGGYLYIPANKRNFVESKIGHVKISTYLSRDLAARLKALSERTRVPQAAYFREAVEDLLRKYESSRNGRK